MIQPNANPESAAVIGNSWPEHDEDAFRADAEQQRAMAEAAASGATAVSVAGEQTAAALTGATGSALQVKLGADTAALGAAGDRHAEAASHLDAAVVNIEEAKAAMNAVDGDYHEQLAAMTTRASIEGWSTVEIAAARTDLLGQAQQAIANIRAGFDGAYEGVISALTATSGAGAPTMAPGTVEVPPAGGTTAHQMGQATGSAAVEFASGMLSGITGQAGGAGGLGVGGGVYAPGYGPGMLGGMGTGYGVLAPGYGGMGMGGYGAGGYGMGGMGGMGMGGYGMGGMGMGGMGMGVQPTPLNQLGQVVGGIAQSVLGGGQAGVAGQVGVTGQAGLAGLLEGQAGAAGQTSAGGAQGGLAALLQQGGLTGDLNGAFNASAELTTDLASATSGDDVTKAISDAVDAVIADPEGVNVPDDAAGIDTGDENPAGGEGAAAADDAAAGDGAEGEKPEDGSIPARPVADTTPPVDPVTRLQTDVNNAIAGAAAAAQGTVDATADAARAAMNTSVGFVTTGDDGSVRADTVGMQGVQHIDAIRTETSAADLGGRDSGPAPAQASASPAAAPTAPYGAGAPMMTPTGVPGAPSTPIAPASGAGPTPTGRPTAPEPGRLHRLDETTTSSHTAPSGTDLATAAAAAATAVPSFLSLLRGPVAGAHTRLALMRVQQFTNNAVTASAIGVFESDTTVTYVLATAHGVSYLPHDGAIPPDTRLLAELVDDHFYGRWCGHMDPVAKLTDFAAGTGHPFGQLSYVLTTVDGVHIPGVEVVTQSLSDVKSLVDSELLAPISRSRRDLVLARDTSLGDEVRAMSMRTQVLRSDQYLHAFSSASKALWSNNVDQAPYLEQWLRVLTADALRSADRGSAEDAWYAVAEYRRAEQAFAPSH